MCQYLPPLEEDKNYVAFAFSQPLFSVHLQYLKSSKQNSYEKKRKKLRRHFLSDSVDNTSSKTSIFHLGIVFGQLSIPTILFV